MVEHSASHLVDAHLLFTTEAQDINSVLFSKEVSTQKIITLENTLRSAVLILHLINKIFKYFKQSLVCKVKYFKLITYISGFQLNFVINAGHSNMTLAAHGEVVGVGCKECQLCRSERVDKLIRSLQNKTVNKFKTFQQLNLFTNQLRFVVGHNLVEDVVASFIGKLE